VTHVNVNNTGACLRLSTFTSHNKNMLLNKLALFLRNAFIKGFKSAPQLYNLIITANSSLYEFAN